MTERWPRPRTGLPDGSRILPLAWAGLLVSFSAAGDAGLPVHRPVPGGIAVLPLNLQGEDKPSARFGEREVLVSRDGERWVAVVGLPCTMLPGNYIVSLTGEDLESVSVELGVIPHAPLNDGSDEVDGGAVRSGAPQAPDPASGDVVFNPTLAQAPAVDPEAHSGLIPDFDFRAPVESRRIVRFGPMPSSTGLRCHDYLSFLLAPGSRIYTPAEGRVAAVDRTREHGIRITLAHGGGVVSVLGNLRTALVETGQRLDQGEILGTVGIADGSDSGRLDWAIALNGSRVDPLQFSATP